MEWIIIDGIGPFFRGHKPKRINWSKVPFSHIETADGLDARRTETISRDFGRLVSAAAPLGFTAVTLDDASHLIPCPDYPAALSRKISAYRTFYSELFDIAAASGLVPFITMDIMSYHPVLEARVGRDPVDVAEWLRARLGELFADMPRLGGIIMRFGESDGLDVEGDFRSQLVLRTASQVRRFIDTVLPVFEEYDRLLIFRTWSVGVHPVGDLIWNRNTFDRAFKGICSRHFVISMKYGETDFFRYLPLNKLFFRSDHQKIIELQTRREYEGFGEYPSFVGFDYERSLDDLRGARNVVGAMIWCQTGGWGKTRRLTYVRKSSVWVELNTFVTARLCQGQTCDEAVAAYCQAQYPVIDVDAFMAFLRLSDQVIKDLLYIPEFAARKLFFRRLRVPPLIHVYWDRIIINAALRKFLRWFVQDHEAALAEAEEGYRALEQMLVLAREHGLPDTGLDFQKATFEIILEARRYVFMPYSPAMKEHIVALKTAYRKQFKRQYSIHLGFEPTGLSYRQIRWIYLMFFRHRRGYRVFDRVLGMRLLSWSYPLIAAWHKRRGPRFARKQGMGMGAVFK